MTVLHPLSAVPLDVLPLSTSTLTFVTGDTQECVPIQVVDDALFEDTESFTISIFSSNFNILLAADRISANVLIADNEGTNNKFLDLELYMPRPITVEVLCIHMCRVGTHMQCIYRSVIKYWQVQSSRYSRTLIRG